MMQFFVFPNQSVIILTAAVTGLVIWYLVRLFLFYRNYPPGPWGVPILGHLLLLGSEPAKTLAQWKNIYGPIISIRLGSYPTIVLNDVKLIREAFSRSVFSGRPKLTCFAAAGEHSLGFGDGPLVLEQRQFVIKQLKEFATDSRLMEEKILEEIHEVMEDLKKKSGQILNFGDNQLFFTIPILNAIWSLFMGQRFEHGDQRILQLGKSASDFFETAGFLSTLTVFVPWISKITSKGIKKQIEGGEAIYNFVEAGFQEKLPASYVPDQPRNFKEAFLDQVRLHENDQSSSFHSSHNLFQFIAGDIFIGAIDTTAKTLNWFLVYMLRHPKICQKLVTEVDSVIGPSRQPSLSDRPQLNYTEAVISEVLRYSSFTPLGNFHRTLEDVSFHGYKIPKDTVVLGNMWGVHFDPEIWKEPHNFWPERFLDTKGKYVKSDNLISFGLGKRSCVGTMMARDQLLLYVTSLVQKFKFSFPPSRPPSGEAVPSLQMAPQAFEIIFMERN